MKRYVLPVLIAAALGACALTPPLEAPQVDVPARYKEDLAPAERGSWKPAQPADAAPRGEWWRVFDDAVLDDLIAQATGTNPSLQAAAARVAQARAILGVTNADRSVQVDAGAGPTRGRSSAVSQGGSGGEVPTATVWRGLVTASYEVDLFGRVAASVDAARNDYAAEMASLRSVLLALQADVAQAYYALREADEELRLLREAVALREESVRLLERRHQLGDIGELDLARAQTELAVAQSDATALERSRAQIEHGLAILLGKAPAAFEIAPAPLPDAVPAVPAGLPSELLERRPDIAAAQRAMAAANARIGVARSAFFPALRLTAQGGFESAELADLFQWSSRTWVLGPLIGTILTLPLIDGGRNQANLERSYAVLEEAVADYRGRVLGAFGEVEDRLVSLRTLAEQRAATHRAVDSATRALRIATARYDAGASSYLDVIDAQRSLLAMQRLDTRIRGERAVATVALIRALGGGWSMQAGDAVGMTR